MKPYRLAGVFVWSLIILFYGVSAYGATHDISIERIEIDPPVPSVGEPFKIDGLAKNLGTDEQREVDVSFLIDGTETGRVRISKLKAGDEKWVHDFHTVTDTGEFVVSVRSLLANDENPENDLKQIVLAAVGDDDDDDDGYDDGDDDGDTPPSDDPPADDDPPIVDPPPVDDGTGDDDGEDDDGLFSAYYTVSVENNTRAAIRFDFSLDSYAYDHSLELAPGTTRDSGSFSTTPGFHSCYGRWQYSGTGSWYYVEQIRFLSLNDTREFGFKIDPVSLRAEGQVVGDSGPLSGAAVALLADGETEATVRTGSTGRFIFRGLEFGGIYSLRITRDGYLDKRVDLGRIASDVNIGAVYMEAEAPGPGDDDPGDDEPPAPIDSDGDGVIDDDDAFPNDPGEFADADGDGIGDNADDDDDDDGMPDSWEIAHGLDPLVDDSAGDPDGDGVTNLDEYLAGTDPNMFEENFPPGIPELLAPVNAAGGMPIAARLEAGGFADRDGDKHRRTRWQIAERADFSSPAFDRQSERFLTRLDVPNLVLLGETTYYWRVQYTDTRGGTSQWSETRSFTTAAWTADADRNGISDAVEHIEYSDLDDNGIADLEQEDIHCISAARDTDRVMGVFCPQAAGYIECLEVVYHGDIADETDRPARMPFNLVNFRVKLPQPGGSVRLKIYLSEALSGDTAWYKYDPLTGWLDFSEAAVFDGNGQVVEFEVRDGGSGDVDGVANGVIVDPSGIGAEAAAYRDDDDDDDDSGWYVGCFIRSLFE